MAESSSPPLSSYIMDEETLKRKQKEKLKKLMATGGNPRPARSLLFFTLRNPFRKACITVVEWKYPQKRGGVGGLHFTQICCSSGGSEPRTVCKMEKKEKKSTEKNVCPSYSHVQTF